MSRSKPKSRRVIHCTLFRWRPTNFSEGKMTCTFYSNFELGIYEDNFKIPFLEYRDIFSMLKWQYTNMSKMPARCQLLVREQFFGFTVEYANSQVRFSFQTSCGKVKIKKEKKQSFDIFCLLGSPIA